MIRQTLAALLALGLVCTGAYAQTTPKIFVASTGDNNNDGGRTTPKRSFQAAHDAVDDGGEIVVLDTAGYAPVTINKSVSIIVPPGVVGFINATSGPGITILARTSNVNLRGLVIEGAGANTPFGIYAPLVSTLTVEDTTIRNFQDGILFTAFGQLVVRNGAIRDNSMFGIAFSPENGPGSASAFISDTELTNDNTALASAVGAPQTPAVATYVHVSRCAVSGNTTAFDTKASAFLILDGCTMVNNTTVFKTEDQNTVQAVNNTSAVDYINYGPAPRLFVTR